GVCCSFRETSWESERFSLAGQHLRRATSFHRPRNDLKREEEGEGGRQQADRGRATRIPPSSNQAPFENTYLPQRAIGATTARGRSSRISPPSAASWSAAGR